MHTCCVDIGYLKCVFEFDTLPTCQLENHSPNCSPSTVLYSICWNRFQVIQTLVWSSLSKTALQHHSAAQNDVCYRTILYTTCAIIQYSVTKILDLCFSLQKSCSSFLPIGRRVAIIWGDHPSPGDAVGGAAGRLPVFCGLLTRTNCASRHWIPKPQ